MFVHFYLKSINIHKMNAYTYNCSFEMMYCLISKDNTVPAKTEADIQFKPVLPGFAVPPIYDIPGVHTQRKENKWEQKIMC